MENEKKDHVGTKGIPPHQLLKLQILKYQENVYMALDEYYSRLYFGSSARINQVKASVKVIFTMTKPYFKRWMVKDEEFNKLTLLTESDNPDDVIEAFDIINEYLDKKNITKIDTLQDYDTSIAEYDNIQKGF